MKLALSAAAIAAASLLCACGNGAPAPGAPAAVNGDAGTGSAPAAAAPAGTDTAATDCSYISSAQLSQIEGASYAAPTVFNHQICNWIGSDGNSVSITLTRNATAASWADVLDTVQGDQRSGDPAPIPGLGDKAAGVGLEIAVQHGSVIIDIRNGDSPGFGKWPKSAAIANAIIAGLH